MRSWLACVLAAVSLAGCGAVMCSFTGNAIGHCPSLKRAAAEQSASGGEEAPAEEAPAAETSAPAEAKPAEAEPRSCLATGTKTENYHRCCSDSFKTQIEASDNIYTCG